MLAKNTTGVLACRGNQAKCSAIRAIGLESDCSNSRAPRVESHNSARLATRAPDQQRGAGIPLSGLGDPPGQNFGQRVPLQQVDLGWCVLLDYLARND